MKYKALFVFFFGIVLSLISIQNSFAGWPISYTPAIEGVITDATTGKPIENVVVSCVWYKTRMSIGDTVDQAFGSKIVVTKTDGKFSFPSKTGFHVLSWFDSVMLQVSHPLYESKMNSFNKEDIAHLKKGETQYNSGGVRVIPAKYENGKIKYEVSSLSIEEAYLKPLNLMKEGKIEIDDVFINKISMGGWGFGAYEDASYWKILRKNNISIDLNETFAVWDAIVANIINILNWPQNASINTKLHRVENNIVKELSSR